ncbi:hypothetical protein [Streptomyces sp. NRRL S-337]|uniref:hypothetical protein n=1 Tax=Streptomyces sp. NRRL S-337 TaxID=1463900 RepID=UPI0004CBB313|nr:hypothetical protein [Streptomyces sp. NRRL S-337]
MSAIDPASRIRPDWWTDETFLQLCALEDQALPDRGLSQAEREHPTQPVLHSLLRAMWSLGKTGGRSEKDAGLERVQEALREVEAHAERAAQAARLTLSRLVSRNEDDELAATDRECERNDPNWGPPETHLTEASFTVRLPGYSGDTVSATIGVDGNGAMTVAGSGPLAITNALGRLDARAVINAIENLVDRQLTAPIPCEGNQPSPS